MTMQKIKYFLNSLLKILSRKNIYCPSCYSKNYNLVKKKFLVTSLKRCMNCKLLYRSPSASNDENKKFYNNEYEHGFTTNLPDKINLSKMLNSNFANTEKNFSNKIKILKVLSNNFAPKNSKLFDYGCSWGYGSYQLMKKFNVKAYEISKKCANFAAKNLDIDIISKNKLKSKKKFDFFFCSHVLEHVPNVSNLLRFAMRVTKKDGFILFFTPNGSNYHQKINKNYHKLWGMFHPNLLDEKFYQSFFIKKIYYIGSSDYNLLNIKIFFKKKKVFIDKLSGDELLIIIKN
jgi:2-polyprenyl-3-methyl-5-hydroxy-6-metoxy-1,4-benzoquinol methylase